ncbi:MAG: ATP-binding cassette domain-containing protein [Terriglobales bacterium]
MLEVCHLSKDYGPFHAVQDVSFTARAGEVVGFLGPNGAGKTTTMRLITGYLPPTAGEVKVDGLTVRTNALEAKRRIGYLPELPPIYPELTVDEYLHFVGRLRRLPSRQRRDAVERACKRTALSDVRHRIIGHLSKGYRQRVGIAQAILHDPPLLILDEPTAGLDPRQIIETRQLIRELAGKHTVIISTHILSEAAANCERVVIINRGALVAVDTPENLTHRLKQTDSLTLQVRGPVEAVTAALANAPGVLKAAFRHDQKGVGVWELEVQNPAVREALARLVHEKGWGLVELRARDLSLEEIFLSLTGGDPAAQPQLQAGAPPAQLGLPGPAPDAAQPGLGLPGPPAPASTSGTRGEAAQGPAPDKGAQA